METRKANGELQLMRPDSIHELFGAFLNGGDLDGVMHLYEPDACLIERTGNIVKGAGAIREYLARLLAARPRIHIERPHTIAVGEVAVLVSTWELTGTGPDGTPISEGGRSYDVVHRHPDGTWRIAIDNPWGVTP